MSDAVRPRLIVVGGFLGAGKTTTIQRSAEQLRATGKRVAIITNDQSSALVDTEVARAVSDIVAEIPDGCFCCKFDVLEETLKTLVQGAVPDVILAEAVGSCTDLAATVLQPLRQLGVDLTDLGPLTVVVDGRLLRNICVPTEAMRFPAPVMYLFERQLAEADVILLNKVDQLTSAQQVELLAYLSETYPEATIFPITAMTGEGLSAWLDTLTQDGPGGDRVLDLDYDRYAEAESMLGWTNLTGSVQLPHTDNSGAIWINTLLESIAASAERANTQVAHVKAWIDTPTGSIRGHLVGSSRSADIFVTGAASLEGRVLLNARAPIPHNTLREWMSQAIEQASNAANAPFVAISTTSFSPPRPVPIHRLLPANQ